MQEDIKYAETQCLATATFINNTEKQYKKQSEDNENELKGISMKIDAFNLKILDLNQLVCDRRNENQDNLCDAICGGAGCNNCGNSISCDRGAKQQAQTAIRNANDSEVALRNKESLANDLIRNVSMTNFYC